MSINYTAYGILCIFLFLICETYSMYTNQEAIFHIAIYFIDIKVKFVIYQINNNSSGVKINV